VLSFRLGKIPVRVQAWFFVLTVFLGMSDPGMLPAWVAIVFVSVLIHELGHATTGLVFGLQPSIELHGMGGTTSWSTAKKLSTLQRIAISLAGPFAGFGVGALVYAANREGLFPHGGWWDDFVKQALFVNVGWGVLNLLPMLPLDGGNVMTATLNAMTHGRGERPARIVSIGVAVLVGVFAIIGQYLATGQLNWWGALLVMSFVATNYQGLQGLRAQEGDAPMRDALKQAYEALDARDAERVLALARPVALTAKTAQVRAEALQLVAFGFLLEGRVADADAAIAALPAGYHPHAKLLEMRAAAVTASPAHG
jgi:Zn-dependent protease